MQGQKKSLQFSSLSYSTIVQRQDAWLWKPKVNIPFDSEGFKDNQAIGVRIPVVEPTYLQEAQMIDLQEVKSLRDTLSLLGDNTEIRRCLEELDIIIIGYDAITSSTMGCAVLVDAMRDAQDLLRTLTSTIGSSVKN